MRSIMGSTIMSLNIFFWARKLVKKERIEKKNTLYIWHFQSGFVCQPRKPISKIEF